MKPGIAERKEHQKEITFDITKAWYLLPNDPDDSFFGHLFEGKVLHDKSAFRKRKDGSIKSRIRISDFTNLCRELSEPYVYPIRIEKKTRVETADQYSWFVPKVTLLEPINVWQIFSEFHNIFQGTINLNGQPYLPHGLVLPSIVNGDMVFNDCILPSKITLPEVVKGEMKIEFCTIPPTWKFPQKIHKLSFFQSSFYDNIDFKAIVFSELKLEGCLYEPPLSLPKIIPGKLEISNDTITSKFLFPLEVGDLSLSFIKFEDGTVLPNKIAGSFSLYEIGFTSKIAMPGFCKSISALECDFPVDFKWPVKGLEDIELIYCTLPEDFVLTKIPLKKLSFISMEIHSGLKLPDEFNGILEFEDTEIAAGFKLPGKFNGQLKIRNSVISGKLKLPADGKYDIFMDEADDTTNLIASKQILDKIIFSKYESITDLNNDLPF